MPYEYFKAICNYIIDKEYVIYMHLFPNNAIQWFLPVQAGDLKYYIKSIMMTNVFTRFIFGILHEKSYKIIELQ